MKDYAVRKYPDDHSNYDRLRQGAKEAWDAITAEELLQLVRSMKDRCQAVIDVDGRHIPPGHLRALSAAPESIVKLYFLYGKTASSGKVCGFLSSGG